MSESSDPSPGVIESRLTALEEAVDEIRQSLTVMTEVVEARTQIAHDLVAQIERERVRIGCLQADLDALNRAVRAISSGASPEGADQPASGVPAAAESGAAPARPD